MAEYVLTQSASEVQAALNRAQVATTTKTLTSAEYNALEKKDPNTIYVISDEDGGLSEDEIQGIVDRVIAELPTYDNAVTIE